MFIIILRRVNDGSPDTASVSIAHDSGQGSSCVAPVTGGIGAFLLLDVRHLALNLFEVEYEVLQLFIVRVRVMLPVSGSTAS